MCACACVYVCVRARVGAYACACVCVRVGARMRSCRRSSGRIHAFAHRRNAHARRFCAFSRSYGVSGALGGHLSVAGRLVALRAQKRAKTGMWRFRRVFALALCVRVCVYVYVCGRLCVCVRSHVRMCAHALVCTCALSCACALTRSHARMGGRSR